MHSLNVEACTCSSSSPSSPRKISTWLQRLTPVMLMFTTTGDRYDDLMCILEFSSKEMLKSKPLCRMFMILIFSHVIFICRFWWIRCCCYCNSTSNPCWVHDPAKLMAVSPQKIHFLAWLKFSVEKIVGNCLHWRTDYPKSYVRGVQTRSYTCLEVSSIIGV